MFSNPMALMYDMQSPDYQDMLAFNAAVNNAAQDTPVPSCVQSAIASGAQSAGLDLTAFENSFSVQIVGTPNGQGGTTPFGETELNMTGTPDQVQALIQQLCNLGFYSNGPCGANSPGIGTAHTGFTGNFRAPGLTDSLQVNTNLNAGGGIGVVQMDIDNYNPADSVWGWLGHAFLQYLPNKLTGTDNTYGCPMQSQP